VVRVVCDADAVRLSDGTYQLRVVTRNNDDLINALNESVEKPVEHRAPSHIEEELVSPHPAALPGG
jgi:hypothetical protein